MNILECYFSWKGKKNFLKFHPPVNGSEKVSHPNNFLLKVFIPPPNLAHPVPSIEFDQLQNSGLFVGGYLTFGKYKHKSDYVMHIGREYFDVYGLSSLNFLFK